MRLLIVSPYFPPRNAIGALRVHAFARCWAEAGDDVTVLTTLKREHQRGAELPCDGFEVVELDYETPVLLDRLRRVLRREPTAGNGVGAGHVAPISRRRRWGVRSTLRHVQDRSGVFGSMRMPDFTDPWVRPAVRWANEQPRFDLVFSSAGPYTAHLVALALKRRCPSIKWVAEYRDLWVGNPLHRGLFPFTMRERWLERRCLDEADRLVTVSEPLARHLAAKCDTPVDVVLNGFDERELEELPAAPIFERNGLVRLVFTGTLYPAGQDPTPLLRTFARLQADGADGRERIRLVVAGPTGREWRLHAHAAGTESWLVDRGSVSRADARRLQRDADALVLVDFDRRMPGVLTGKLFEYLSVDPPILAIGGSSDSPIAEMIRRTGRGLVLGHDVERIAAVLRSIIAGRPILDRPPDRALLATLTRDHQAQRLHESLVSLVAVGDEVHDVVRTMGFSR